MVSVDHRARFTGDDSWTDASGVTALPAYVLTADHRVPDFDRWWSLVRAQESTLAALIARPLLVYRGLSDPNRVFLSMGIGARDPLDEVLRSGAIVDWFATAGVEDVPPVFVGRDGDRFASPQPDDSLSSPPEVIVATVALVPDPDAVMGLITRDVERIRARGVRETWIYRALDDASEVLVVLALDSVEHAATWLERSAVFSNRLAGVDDGVHPPVFAGILSGTVEPDRLR